MAAKSSRLGIIAQTGRLPGLPICYKYPMCGRYTLYCSSGDIADLIGVQLSEHQFSLYRSSRGYNVAPSQTAPIVLLKEDQRVIVPARWGFHPAWAREDAPSPINARAETVFDKPFFRSATSNVVVWCRLQAGTNGRPSPVPRSDRSSSGQRTPGFSPSRGSSSRRTTSLGGHSPSLSGLQLRESPHYIHVNPSVSVPRTTTPGSILGHRKPSSRGYWPIERPTTTGVR